MDVRDIIISNIRGGIIGFICAGIVLLLIWFVAFMVAFGNSGPFADAYLPVAAFLLSGIVPSSFV